MRPAAVSQATVTGRNASGRRHTSAGDRTQYVGPPVRVMTFFSPMIG
jgi:hypothetical protein